MTSCSRKCGFLFQQKSCDVKHDTKTVCQTPKRQQKQSDVQPVFVHFDGLSITVEIEYVDDPHFTQFQSVLEYDKESSIQINVSVIQ